MDLTGPAVDGELLARLRQLALVEIDALLFGARAEDQAPLVLGFRDDLLDALAIAEERRAEMVARLGDRGAVGAAEVWGAQAADGAGDAGGAVEGALRLGAAEALALSQLMAACAQLAGGVARANRWLLGRPGA